jgi:hypothetical protein
LHPLAEPAEPDAPPVAPLWAVPRPEEAAAVAAVAVAVVAVVSRAPEVVAVAGMAASPSAQREAVAVVAAMVALRAPEAAAAAAGTEARRADARHPRGAGCRRDRLHHDRQDRDRWAAVPRWGPGQASAMTPVVVPAVAAEEEVVVVAATHCAPVRLNARAHCGLHRADRTRPADPCSAWRQASSMAECQTRPEAWRRGASWMARHRVA